MTIDTQLANHARVIRKLKTSVEMLTTHVQALEAWVDAATAIMIEAGLAEDPDAPEKPAKQKTAKRKKAVRQ